MKLKKLSSLLVIYLQDCQIGKTHQIWSRSQSVWIELPNIEYKKYWTLGN